MQRQYIFKLKASSLANTVFVCLVIAIFCGGIVLISHYNILISSKLELQNELVDRNDSAFIYFLNNLESIPNEYSIDVFNDGISSYVEEKKWGFYTILNCKTIFKRDTIIKTALIGKKSDSTNNLALYVTNYNKPLKFSGYCNISGSIKVPNGRTEQAFINGVKGNNIKITGQSLKSLNKLPKLEKIISIDHENFKEVFLDESNRQFVNSFNNKTVTITFDKMKQLDNVILKGNIIIYSKKKIEINASTVLNDVLLIAPRVSIKEGFKGNVQILADKEVVIEDNVSLTYPSSIYIENDLDSTSVSVGRNSKIAGGIVVNGSTYKGSLKRQLVIDKGATIIGNIYCYGKTQLQGNIIGSIYTDRFFLKTGTSSYENIILNATIEKDNLHKDFIELPLFKNNSSKIEYDVIKTF